MSDATTSTAPEVKGCWTAAVRLLADTGTDTAFGLPADDLDLLAALDGSGIRLVLCRDQRNALFMAVGYALQSGRTGIAFTGKGPAVTNTVTGLLEAASAAAPVVLLSAGTPVGRLGSAAFQELDQLSLVRPLVKWAARVDDPARLAPMLRRALLVARTGVPGPVYLELPDHLLSAKIPLPPAFADLGPEASVPRTVQLAENAPALRVLRAAHRPVLLVGGGMRHRNERRLLEDLADRMGAAVFSTASGRGVFDEDHPAFCGLAGLYVPEAAQGLWRDTDCVLTLGSRLEETATYGWPEAIGRTVPVVQVNVDAGDLNTDYAGPVVVADAAALLAGQLVRENVCAPESAWRERVHAVHAGLHADHAHYLEGLAAGDGDGVAEDRGTRVPRIPQILAALAGVLPEDTVLVQENGLQDMWSYRYPVHRVRAGGGSVVPSEQTPLGFGAAAAAGVKAAAPHRPVVALVGDGAFSMVDADLPTLVDEGLGVLYVVLSNGGYGWLQSQLDQRETPVPGHRFTDPARAGAAGAAPGGVHRAELTDLGTLHARIEHAWQECLKERPAVLVAQVSLEDSLFGTAEAGGDFPLLPAPLVPDAPGTPSADGTAAAAEPSDATEGAG